ncbi:MAG: holo-ACP synthase [Chitinispirillales bacterium]|jgi:holo-[acyl-carrier protein] synthase|nr:holo-ACP synthase [Chitinispirillales bacterium]
MITGIGVDICSVERMKKVLSKPHSQNFKKKVFCESEIEYCKKMGDNPVHFAARWAIKEAFYKALPYEIQDISGWRSIEYINFEQARPFIRITDEKLSKALHSLGISKIHCSVSHEKEYCVAQVVLEKL